jgi:hypothetical protein
MNLTEKASLIVAFSEIDLVEDEYSDFFAYNDLGVPLAISLTLGYIKLRTAGEEVIGETWRDLCATLGANPLSKYKSLEDLFLAGKQALPRIDIQKSINLNNEGHRAFMSGDAEKALRLWTAASDLGQPNSITSLVWLNVMLNKFNQLDSIIFEQPDLGRLGYGGRTESWRDQYDALTGDPSIGASQFDSQKEAVSYNSALCAWLSGDDNRALAFLALAGDGAEAEFLRATINGVPGSEMELDQGQVTELIGIYELAIENFERIKSFDSSLIEPWEGKTLAQFAAESIETLSYLAPVRSTDFFTSSETNHENFATEMEEFDRPSFGDFAEIMQSAVDGEREDIQEIAKLGMQIFGQHEELEDHEEDGWDLESLWFGVVEESIAQLLDEPESLANSDLLDAIVLLSEHDSHLLCLLLVQDVNRNLIDENFLQQISRADPCGHDTGRSESCIGWQVRLAMHSKTPPTVLLQLHNETNCTDQNSLRWALAMNPNSPRELLNQYAVSFGSGWRIKGEIEEYGISGVSVSEVDAQIQSFIRWAVAGNPSLGLPERSALSEASADALQELNYENLDNLALEIRKRSVSATQSS